MLGLIAYLRNGSSQTNQAFLFACTSLSLWIVTGGYMTNLFAPFLPNLTFWSRATIFLAILLTMSFFYIGVVFPKSKAKLTWFQRLWLLIGLILLLLIPTNLFIKKAFVENNAVNFTDGPLQPILASWIVISTLFFFYIVTKKYRQSKGLAKTQFKYFFLGMFLFIGIGVITNVIIADFFGSEAFLNFGLYASIFFVGFTSYAIIVHRLLDIRLIIVRSVAYFITLGLLIFSYVLITFSLTSRYRGFTSQNLIDTATLVFLIALFNPLKNIIDKGTDKLFYRGKYDFDLLLEKINEIVINNPRNVNKLTLNIIDAYIKNIRVKRGAFIILSSPKIENVTAVNYPKDVSFWQELINKTHKIKNILVYDELADDNELKPLLRKNNISVLLPILTERHIEGTLALGEKRSGDTYSVQDLRLLELTSNQIALAIENARLYKQQKEVAYFNKSLADIDTVIHSTLDYEDILYETLNRAVEAMKCEVAGINIKKDDIWTRALRGLPLTSVGVQLTQEKQLIASLVEKAKEAVVINDTSKDIRVDKSLVERYGIKSIMVIPLIIKDKNEGLLFFNYHSKTVTFSNSQIDFATKLSYSISLAYENAELYNALKETGGREAG